ncbi:hypothetical protein E2493_02825 [Sphingomonas parva]|uniref:Uncharacterized protein n=1 Tax=Sphingomonas parva TaxID=2555898 RepID=A0A4Y8ZWE5_9SPHN|nr:hypothetical protein [Sphingomonas parva]TFI59787.1 hypothetical protein E2493_02825 [Sphingomonas parva]
MFGLDRVTRMLVGVVVTALMMLVAATPALAELGCFEATVNKAAYVSVLASVTPVAAPQDEQDQRKSKPGGAPVHSAFGHCAHGVLAPSAVPEQAQMGYSSTAYIRRVEPCLIDADVVGPEHPPKF